MSEQVKELGSSRASSDAAEDAAPMGLSPLEWEAVADEAMASVAARVEPFARKAADEFYARVLETAQDYLCDNAKFNIAERIHASERAAREARQEASQLREQRNALIGPLRGFIVNRAAITAHEPFRGALSRLMDLAEVAISKAEGAS